VDTKANYALIGLFVIVLTAVMAFFFVWLSGLGEHQAYQMYLVYARGGVTGLNVDSPVLYNGVRVGMVAKIELDNSNLQFVKLYLKINSKTPITESTVATLIPQGITGLVYVGLKSQTAGAALLKIEKGQKYPIIPYEKPLLTQLSEVLPELARNMSAIAEKFKKMFSDQNLTNVSETLTHINNVTGVFEKRSKDINRSISSMNVFLKNSAAASRHFESTVIAAQKTAAQLNKTSTQINAQINAMAPTVDELVTRLNETANNLQQVSQDLQRNPSILIRGKQPPPPGPGE